MNLPEAILELTVEAQDRRYGRILNHHISESSAEWIIVRDSDTMYLTHDRGNIIRQAIKDHPDAELMSCLTNRVGMPQFTVRDMFDETDITRHIGRAIVQAQKREYRQVDGIVPGYWYLFPRSTWINHPFDDDVLITDASWDVRWTRQITGKKITILGLYIFHLYRLQFDHRWETGHLRGEL